MYGTAASPARKSIGIRFHDRGTLAWIWAQAPCNWLNHTDVRFINVPLSQLEHAGSLTDPDVSAKWLARMKSGRPVPPPVACRTESGKLYLRDGNHRYLAMREFLDHDPQAIVRVALIVPRKGLHFRYRWFGSYGTYLLEPKSIGLNSASMLKQSVPQVRGCPILSEAKGGDVGANLGGSRSTEQSEPFTGRTLVLVAHPDDETACAGLLQRLHSPVVVYASDGAPADEFFWKSHGSRHQYSLVRRQEAIAALSAAGASHIEFLNDSALDGMRFRDQELHLSLRSLSEEVCALVRRYRPKSILVPAYEGGHPDHDSCSFLGHLIGRRFRIPVWEMPLYHRSEAGALVCGRFRATDGSELALHLSQRELRARRAMIASYGSQQDLSEYLISSVEYYRLQPEYNYALPPHSGRLNYEVWEWPIPPMEVCRCFQDCLTFSVRKQAAIMSGWNLQVLGATTHTTEAGLP